MRFRITLVPRSKDSIIPINYQYPLSAVIYKVLAEADSGYATFLHEKGYQVEEGLKRFKLFTFSDLRMQFKLRGDRMSIKSNPEFTVSFHLPEAAQNFIKGLFINREIDIADAKSRATFSVQQVEALAALDIPKGTIDSVNFNLLSMIICGKKKENGDYEFLAPHHEDWQLMMVHNWKEKCKAAGLQYSETELAIMDIESSWDQKKPTSRLIVIKAETKAQTKIKGYRDFAIRAAGPSGALELLYNAGCGVYNSLGCGCLGTGEDHSNKKRNR